MSTVYEQACRDQQKRSCNSETSTITKVTESNEGYSLETSSLSCFWVPKPAKIVPMVGQVVTLYLRGGWTIRGIDLDREELFFKTDEDLDAERQEAVKKHREEEAIEKQAFDKELADPDSEFNRRLGALPKVFKQRFEKFFRLGENFWEHAWYELVACETALKIAYACRGWQNIRKFSKMGWEKQKEMIPRLDDGLSGNQFWFACAVASIYLKNSKDVVRVRGALSPLVGSKPYIGR